MGDDQFTQFFMNMQESKNYLHMESLLNGHSYKIFARNACVGIWNEKEKAFLISRYKVGPNPSLFHEYHWDFDDRIGTVKPLEHIEKCPFEILDRYHNNNQEYESTIIHYLNKLEDNNPIVKNYNSRHERLTGAINFATRLARRK